MANAKFMPVLDCLRTVAAPLMSDGLAAAKMAALNCSAARALIVCTKLAVCAVFVAGVGGFGALATVPASKSQDIHGDSTTASRPAQDVKSQIKLDAGGDPLPGGAIARLGTARFSNVGRPLAVSFSRDGALLVTGSWDGVVSVWDRRTSKLMHEWNPAGGPVRAVAISPDAAMVATVSTAPEIHLWRRADGQHLKTLTGQKDGVSAVAFSPGGKHLLSTGWRSVRLWDITKGEPIYSSDDWGSASFQANDSGLTVVHWKNRQGEPISRISFIDYQTGKAPVNISLADGTLPNDGYFGDEEFFVLPSGRWLVYVGADRKIRKTGVWLTELGTGRKKRVVENDWGRVDEIMGYAMSPDERLVALAYPDGALLLVEMATGQIRCRFRRPEGGKTCLDFSPDGRILACGSMDRTVLLWDVTDRLTSGKPKPIRLSAADLGRLWENLDSADGGAANKAIWELVAGDKDATGFLAKELAKIRPADPKRVAESLADLASDSFQVRTKAMKELEDLHDAAEPFLLKKLKEQVPLELSRRITILLDKIEHKAHPRLLRAVEVLEHIGNPASRRILQELSHGEIWVAEEAKWALHRLTSDGLGK